MNGSSLRWLFLPVTLMLSLLAWTSIVSASLTQPRFDQAATNGRHHLAGEVDAAPLRIAVRAGGKLVASDLQLGEACRGYISADSTNVRVEFEQSEDASIEIELESTQRNSLIVNGPDGRWHCALSDDDHKSTLRIDATNSGQIDIWAGSFNDTRRDAATLTVRAVVD